MSISVGGLLSGIDTSSIITQLMQVQRRPIDLMQGDKSNKNVQLSSFKSISDKFSNLLSVVDSMDTTEDFLSKKSTFSNNNSSDNNSVVSISTTSTVTTGSFDLVVTKLAEADKYIHQGVSDENAKISTSAGNFTFTYAGTQTNIAVSTSTTLVGLKNAINSANAEVTATIVNTGAANNNYRLILTGKDTGATNTISVDASSTFGTGFTQQRAAADSEVSLDGITITKESNEVSDIIEGASLSFESVGSGTITFSEDISTVTGKVDAFVTSYNDLMTFINGQLAFDSATDRTGTLFANPTLITLQNKIKTIITDSVSGLSGKYTNLSQIGITTDSKTGNLSVKSSELQDALRDDFSGIGKLFTSFGSTTDSRVTFVGFTKDTKPGTYDLEGVGGFAGQGFLGMMIKKDSEAILRDMEGDSSSKFFTGKSGNDEEGLNLRVEGDNPRSYGTVTLSLGIAAQLQREIEILTDKSIDGPLVTEMNALSGMIDEIDDQIDSASDRLELVEDRLRADFVTLEVQLNRLKSQGDFLSSALSSLGSIKK